MLCSLRAYANFQLIAKKEMLDLAEMTIIQHFLFMTIECSRSVHSIVHDNEKFAKCAFHRCNKVD